MFAFLRNLFPDRIFRHKLEPAAERRLGLAQARAEEAIIRTHVDNALMFVDTLAEDMTFDRAIDSYIREMAIPEPLASTVATRTLVVLGQDLVPVPPPGTRVGRRRRRPPAPPSQRRVTRPRAAAAHDQAGLVSGTAKATATALTQGRGGRRDAEDGRRVEVRRATSRDVFVKAARDASMWLRRPSSHQVASRAAVPKKSGSLSDGPQPPRPSSAPRRLCGEAVCFS